MEMGARYRKFRRFLTASGGSVAVEFVITLPITLAALFLVYELGRTLLAYEIAAQDLRSAIRYLSRAEGADVTNATDPYVIAAKNIAQTGGTSTPNCPADYPATSSTNCHYPWTSGSTITVASTAFGAPPYNLGGNVVTMTASIPMTLSFLSFLYVPTGITVSMSNTAQYIGD